jgi:hypothetical protein
VYYDAFVLDNKRDALYALRTALATLGLTSEAGGTGISSITVSGHLYEDGSPVGALKYKAAASQAAPALGDDLASWSDLTLEGGMAELSLTAGHKLVVAAADEDGRAVAASQPVTVVVGA